ncbi:hypothetical protein Taro_031141 [Colocasia esculenta]|uniref:Uncharacterized protein n=1 Tax=Colocasia esculenta TaxID=4460 RepID=A0A843VN60_COLES|nr:hypothetical protein [Colocasia esculenta]
MTTREQQLQDPFLANEACAGEADIEEISSCGKFLEEAVRENKKLWYLAGPAIFTSIAQYSLGAITQVFAGHLTTLELDAVSTENMVIAGLAFGIMILTPTWKKERSYNFDSAAGQRVHKDPMLMSPKYYFDQVFFDNPQD